MAKIIRNRLRELLAAKGRREGRNISQRQAAQDMGLSKVTVDRWARNEVTRMDTETIRTMCLYLSCAPGDLIIMEGSESDDEGQRKTPLLATA